MIFSDIAGENGIFCDGDWIEKKDQDPNGEVRLIQLADIGAGEFLDKSNRFVSNATAESLNCTLLHEGDLLISRLGEPLCKACIFPLEGKFITAVDVAILRINSAKVDARYLLYLINSPWFKERIKKYESGTTRKRISRKNLDRVEMQFPTVSEQRRIVSRIEELFSELDNSVSTLQKTKEQLAVYRQAVLKEAFEGKFSLIWRKENPTKEVIPTKTVIKITNGKKVPLGRRMNTMRTNPEILSNKRKEFWEDFGLSKDAKRGRKSEKQKQQSVLKEYENLFDGDKEKAERVIKTIQDIRQKRKTNQKEEIKVETILKEFEIDIKYLINCLTKTKKQDARPTKPLLEFQGKTLKQFCIENKFNYDVINRAIRLHQIGINGTLEELINREIVNYKKEPATWIYEKYGNLIKPILDYLQLDSKIILMEMTRNQITLEEALKNEIFEKQKETKENSWLKELYEYLIEEKKLEKIEDNFIRLVKDYHLEQDEIHILWNSFSEYEKKIIWRKRYV